MPEGADPLTSLGYLLAAGGITLGVLLVYAISLGRRLAAARARIREILDRKA